MKSVSYVIYRYLTDNEYFVLYKPAGAETGGGGQRYIDFPTGAISVSKWRRFLADVQGGEEGQVQHGPQWEVPVLNVLVRGSSQQPHPISIYQRRQNSICIANQNISGQRLPAWHPNNGFPQPVEPSQRVSVPPRLTAYLVRTRSNEVWAGWFDADTLESVCRTEEATSQLSRMLDEDNEPGSTGFIECKEGALFLNDDEPDLPVFLSKNELEVGESRRIRCSTLEVRGYKSLNDARLDLDSLNVLIGANGAGKSNLISLFEFMGESLRRNLEDFVQSRGGANAFLHLGSSTTEELIIRATIDTSSTRNILQQRFGYKPPDALYYMERHGGGLSAEEQEREVVVDDVCSVVPERGEVYPARLLVERLQTQVSMLHLLDTSVTAPIRKECYIDDNRRLHPDGGNLAAMLHLYANQYPASYRRIRSTVRKILPSFDDFVLEPQRLNERSILLNWRQKDNKYVFGPHQFSDGSLRAMALIALLLQPDDYLADIVILDEPELGLHPHAVSLVTGLIQGMAERTQVIVSTQSPTFVDEFAPEDVVVVEARGHETRFARLDPDALQDWLQEYSLGELWQKNVIGGGPM